MPIIIRTNINRGLGTILGHLSMLIHSGQAIEFHGNHTLHNTIDVLINTLSIAQIKIIRDNTHNDWDYFENSITDSDKFFAPYFNVDSINYKGNKYPTAEKKKKYIGIACYRNLDPDSVFFSDEFEKESANFRFPRNRHYGIDQYAKLFAQIKLAGYDVLTLDSNMLLDDKIFLLNNHCECMIGYEGGMAHLAHVLKIPCIILPWLRSAEGKEHLSDINYSNGWVPPFNNQVYNKSYIMHLDNRTYFPKDIDEIFKLSTEMLRALINDLQNCKGNNPFFDPNVKIFSHYDYTQFHYTFETRGSICHPITELNSDVATRFAKSMYSGEMKIGGIRSFDTVTAASVVGSVTIGPATSAIGTVTAASVVGGVITGSSASTTGAVLRRPVKRGRIGYNVADHNRP